MPSQVLHAMGLRLGESVSEAGARATRSAIPFQEFGSISPQAAGKLMLYLLPYACVAFHSPLFPHLRCIIEVIDLAIATNDLATACKIMAAALHTA